MLGSRSTKVAAVVIVLAFLVSAVSGGVDFVAASSTTTCTSSPCSSSITITSYNGNDESAISDLIAGKISSYDYELTPVEAESLPSGFSQVSVPNSLYEVMVNPENTTWSAVSSVTSYSPNPFYYPQVRAALNYVLDRSYFVDSILGGAGVPILSVYGVAPDSLTVANGTAAFASYLTYNPALANQTIYNALIKVKGISYNDGRYVYDDNPIPVYLIDRTDDPFRSEYTGFLATQLTNLGFDVIEEPMNLALVKTTAFVEDPVNGTGGSPPTPWDIYIGAFSNVYLYYGDLLQVCFDGANCAAGPYSDNASSSDLAEGEWNTTAQTPPDVVALSDKLDQLNDEILAGTYTSLAQRAQILTNYTELEIEMGVNDWLATGLNVYAYNPSEVSGLVASFTTSPILNTQSYLDMMSTSSSPLDIGVRYLTQYNMNPVGGYGDAYSADLLAGVFPGLEDSGPGTGYTWPFGWTYKVLGTSSSDALSVPSSAINYNSTTGEWYNVTSGAASLAVTLNFANIADHTGYADGESFNLADLLYSYEVGMNVTNPSDSTYDSSLAPTFQLEFDTITGFKMINSTAFTLYSSYYFFDPVEQVMTAVSNIAPYRDGQMPWTMYQAMSDLVAAKDDAWSAVTAAADGIPQLTLVGSGPNGSPTDIANLISDLQARAKENYVPSSLTQLQKLSGVSLGLTSTGAAFTDAANFMKEYGNGLISYGPFYVSTFQASSTPNYAVLTANPYYKLTPYLATQLFAPATRISVSTTVPSTVQPGSSIELTSLSTPIGQTTATPTSGVNIVAQFVSSTSVVAQVTLTTGADGTADLVVPQSLPLGSYTLTVYASSPTSTMIIPQSYSVLVISSTTSKTSFTSTAVTPPTSSLTSTSTSSSTYTTDIAVAAVVVIVIAALAVLVTRRRGAPQAGSQPASKPAQT